MRRIVKNRPRNQAVTIYPEGESAPRALESEIPETSPSEIEQSIRQVRESNLDTRAKELSEKLLRTFLRMVGPM